MNLRMIATTLFVSLFFLSCGGSSSSPTATNDTKPQEDAFGKIVAYVQSDGNTMLPTTSDYNSVGATKVNAKNIDYINSVFAKYITTQYVEKSSNIVELVDSIVLNQAVLIDSEDSVMQTKSITLRLVNTKGSNLSALAWLDGNATILGNAPTQNYEAMNKIGKEFVVVRVKFKDDSVALAYKEIETTAYQNALTQIKGVPPSSVKEDDNYTYNPSIYNPDEDTLTFKATHLPSWLRLDSATGKIWGIPTNADVGIAKDINISVYDGHDVVHIKPFSIEVINVNDAPTIEGTPPPQAYEDSNYSFLPVAKDIDTSTTLLFSSANFPAWLNINAQTGRVSGVPRDSDVGIKNQLRILVSDGEDSDMIEFRLEIIPINDAPQVQSVGKSINIYEDSNFTFDINATDEDNDSFTFRATDLPQWARLDSATGKISGVPTNDDVGLSDPIRVFVRDIHGSESNTSFQINVINTNDAPVFKITKLPDANEDSLYLYTIEVEDVDANDLLEYRVTNLPSWLYIKPANGEVAGIPTNDDVGIAKDINVTVFDGTVSVSRVFDIKVINANDAPQVQSVGKSINIYEDSNFTFDINATDEDNDSFTFRATDLPQWARLDSATGKISGVPTNDDVGLSDPIRVFVRDIHGSESNTSFQINVINTNDAPVFKITKLPDANEDSLYLYTIEVEDVDANDLLEYRVTNLPSWLYIKPANGEVAGIPTNDDVGIAKDINVTVFDGTVSVSRVFDIKVINANDAPTIWGKPSKNSIPATIDFKFTPNADDEDTNTTLSFSIANNPAWMRINSTTGVVSGYPEALDAGEYTGIVVSVSDGITSANLEEFNVTVTPITKPLKTGQELSYVTYDDGYYDKGEIRSFTRADDIVTSTSMRLMWQDNADVIVVKKPWLTELNYQAYRHEDTSGDTAATYCTQLRLGGYSNWRVPSVEELMGISDKSKVNNGVDKLENSIDAQFLYTNGDIYWSSTSLKSESSKAWTVKFDYGSNRWNNKSDAYFVRCVRNKE